jgi:hypothetical protein
VARGTRSRNYPAFGLPEALDKIRRLYDRDGRAAIHADAAVQAWGYSTLNGASLRTLGAVKQYGLLDSPATKTVKLSHDALTILLEEEDSPERREALLRAANSPAMFQEIREQYPDGLPSDQAVTSWLIRNHEFNGKAAEGLIAAYRDTWSLVEQMQKRDIPQRWDRPDDARRDPVGSPPTRAQGTLHMDRTNQFVYSMALPGNAMATLTLEGGPLGEAAVKLLGNFLDLVKQGLLLEAKPIEPMVGPESQTAPGEGSGAA